MFFFSSLRFCFSVFSVILKCTVASPLGTWLQALRRIYSYPIVLPYSNVLSEHLIISLLLIFNNNVYLLAMNIARFSFNWLYEYLLAAASIG